MARPTYEQLENRVKKLESIAGELCDRAMEQYEREISDLKTLCNVSQAVASTMDLGQLLAIVIDEVNKALFTEGAGVLLYDEHRNDLYWRQIRDTRSILAPQSEALRLPMDKSIAGWVFRNKKPARVNDTSKDPRYYPEMTRRSGFDIRKVLQVPLSTHEKTIGVLMVMNKIGGDFTEQDEDLLSSMSGSIALAIENVTVYQKLKKSRDDLEMLYRSSMALATTPDLDHLLNVVITELRRAMDTEAAGVVLYDEVTNDLYWRELQDENRLLDERAKELRLPLDQSINGHVFVTGEPALLNDPTSDPHFYKPFQEQTGILMRNQIIVPLNTREKTIGCLAVINKRGGQFTQDDVQVLSSLAGVVALAVENAKFLEEMISSYHELENLNRAKSKILNHLSHELRTPVAIIRGTLVNMERKLKTIGVTDFDRALDRMDRHIQSLSRLENQVESIMMTGYDWERRQITGFLQSALDLLELQTEYTPEIKQAAQIIHKWLAKTFPTRQDEPEWINLRDFADYLFAYIRTQVAREERNLTLDFSLDEFYLLIPRQVLRAVMEGLIRNAIEATPDHGVVTVTGHARGDRYIFTVKDTGIGIPEKDKELIFEGFYAVQDTESYATRRPYSFNAGGKGIDLLRIRMFSELYDFRLSFKSKRCPHLQELEIKSPVDAELCEHCGLVSECADCGGSEFVVEFQAPSSSPESSPAMN
jgi:GAF domain-containing protein